VDEAARHAPKDASEEARKTKNPMRQRTGIARFGVTRTKNTRYAAKPVKLDLFRVSLVNENNESK